MEFAILSMALISNYDSKNVTTPKQFNLYPNCSGTPRSEFHHATFSREHIHTQIFIGLFCRKGLNEFLETCTE